MAFLFGDLGYLYGANKYDYMSKNGYDSNREFIVASNDTTGYDARHGIVKKYNDANAKIILLAPIGNLGFYRGGGLVSAIKAINWDLVREVIFGKQDGQWYFFVNMWRISTPSMVNQSSLKIKSYMSLAIHSQMPWREYAKEQLFPYIRVNKYTDPDTIMRNFGAQLRQAGYGKISMGDGQKQVISEWAGFADQDLVETARLVESIAASQAALAMDVQGAVEAFWQDEEDQEMQNVEYTPYAPRALRAPKRKYQSVHVAQYNMTFEPAEPKRQRYQAKPFTAMGPANTDYGQRTWKSLRNSIAERKNKRLEVVNFRRNMDPMDSIFRYFPLLIFNWFPGTSYLYSSSKCH